MSITQPDIKKMTDDDLILLFELVKEEIKDRKDLQKIADDINNK